MVIRTIPWSMHGMYKVKHTYAAAIAPEHISLHLLHQRLIHIAPNTICVLIGKGAVEGIELIDNHVPLICDSYEHAKFMCKPIQKERKALLAKAFRDEVHSDLWGPALVQSMGKQKYYIMFTDDSTCYTHLTALHSKDKALNAYKDFISWANT
jgi:hypothetical protein